MYFSDRLAFSSLETAWPVSHQVNHAGKPIYIHTKSKLFKASQNMTKNNL